MNGPLTNKHMPGFPQTSSEARKAYTETMPQQSSKGIANPLHVMCPHHIHQLERAALKRGGQQNIHIPGFDMELFEPPQGHKSTLS